jgi:hypothetical protein
MLCEKCNARFECKGLCMSACSWVDQDKVEWEESPVSVYVEGEILRVFDTDTGVDKPFLTRAEGRVLRILGEGKTRGSVADSLKISVRTVDKHTQNMRRKMRRCLT